ncbi:MAG: hypothetical protein EOO05_14215 [Chitinophagaceae bacterium]|nr:MAG: hypothetical protein EOO05_14215 [Chitinophagaceae bacterium]
MLEPDPQLYPYIRQMAARPRRINDDGQERGFDERECALYGLAKFRKQGDREIIRHALRSHYAELSHVSFRLMQNYPDTAWNQILKKYYRNRFFEFTGYRVAQPEDFINAVVAQQDDSSAALLNRMLDDLPKMRYFPYRDRVDEHLVEQIWLHDIPAYAQIRKRVKPRAEAFGRKVAKFETLETPEIRSRADSGKNKEKLNLMWLDWRDG